MKQVLYKDWDWLQQQYPWIAAMHQVPQSPVHHAEGDVATHTQMVLKALLSLPEYEQLDQSAKDIVWMAALLHDVEKRSTTQISLNGEIASPGHAKKGALTARQLLYTDLTTGFKQRESIVHLVRYHGLPLWVMEKPDPTKALLEAALHCNMQWLYTLSKADVQGRICQDPADLLLRLEYFKELCIEQECWEQMPFFKNSLSRYHYFNTLHSNRSYVPFDDRSCEVILMSGLPGMGKDTYIEKHLAHYAVISLDAIRRQHKVKATDRTGNGRVIQAAKEQARIYLRAGQSFVWNATNITSQMRRQLIDLFDTYKATTRIIYIERPYAIWQQQNRRREAVVNQQALNYLLGKLEVPLLSEACEVEYVVDA